MNGKAKAGKVEAKATAEQLLANVSAVIDALSIGELRTIYTVLLPDGAEIKGRGAVKRLRAAITKRLQEPEMAAPKAPPKRILKFEETPNNARVLYDVGKTQDEIVRLVQKRMNEWLTEQGERVEEFCIGKGSGPDARAALKSRWTKRYSQPRFDYTGMMVLYEDLSRDVKTHAVREKRALAIEEALHAVFNTHERWDKKVDDSPGPKSRTRTARFYVYLAFKLAPEPAPNDAAASQ